MWTLIGIVVAQLVGLLILILINEMDG